MELPAPDAPDPATGPVVQPTTPQPHELGDAPPQWQTPLGPPPAPPRQSPLKKALAPFAAAGVALAKWGAILLKLKAFTLLGTVIVSIAAYTAVFGFTFALGFIALLFLHEMGHFAYFGARGLKPRLPVFIPFLGAYTSAQKAPVNSFDGAMAALAGPGLGMVAAGLLGWRGHETHSTFLYALAFIGFFLNLFNLVPLLPLDGGHAAAALHPGISLIALAVLLAFEIRHPSVFLLVFIVLGGYMAWRRFRNTDPEAEHAYLALTVRQRAVIASLYLGLVAVGLWGESFFYIKRTF